MSTASGKNSYASRGFDYWEFVHCGICFLPFIPDFDNAPTAPPSIPFWLTECGHTLCNNHLHADQSCAACGATAIQLVPLQRDMMPPMCDWFRSVPHGLDAIASAAKSQQETMASLVHFYKRKCIQQRAALNKTKVIAAENKVLRSQLEQLQQEMAQLRGMAGGTANQPLDQETPYESDRRNGVNPALSYQPSENRNMNGKRPLADPQQNQRTSSPRSIFTPIAPSRLTLPPDHQQPIFPSGMNARSQQSEETRDRPGSSRFEPYAYQPPASTFHTPSLRHHQQPQEHHRIQQEQGRQHEVQQQQLHPQGLVQGSGQHMQPQQQQQRMPPPPTPSRVQGTINSRTPFRPAGPIPPQSTRQAPVSRQVQPSAPPPSAVALRQSRPSHDLRPRPFPMSVTTPISSRLVSQELPRVVSSAAPTDRRFAVPATPSNRFFSPRSTTGVVVGTTRGAYTGTNDGGRSTRAPFVPGLG